MLQRTRFFLKSMSKRNFQTTKCRSLFHEKDKSEGMKPTEDKIKWEQMSFKEKLNLEYRLWQESINQWKEEKVENLLESGKVYIQENQVEIIERFTGDKKELEKWIVTSDKDNNEGNSTARLDFTPQSKAVFHGFLDTKVVSDGKVTHTGYCNMKLSPKLSPLQNPRPYDWGPYTHLVFRLRGDGRVYAVNLHMNYLFDVCSYDTYHYFIWTRGGPYWQQVRLPFSKFFFAYKGRLQCWNEPLPKHAVASISITLADKINGPFKLEMDYFGVEFDPGHVEESAYEQYDFGQHRFW